MLHVPKAVNEAGTMPKPSRPIITAGKDVSNIPEMKAAPLMSPELIKTTGRIIISGMIGKTGGMTSIIEKTIISRGITKIQSQVTSLPRLMYITVRADQFIINRHACTMPPTAMPITGICPPKG